MSVMCMPISASIVCVPCLFHLEITCKLCVMFPFQSCFSFSKASFLVGKGCSYCGAKDKYLKYS